MASRNSHSRLGTLVLIALAAAAPSVLLFLEPAPATGADSALEQVEKGVQQIFENARLSVVQIKAVCQSTPQLAVGTGFFVDKSGTIITSAAIVSDSNDTGDIQVAWNGRKYEARRIGFDSRTDLALIKIDATGTPPLNLGDSEKIQKGAMVIGVGYPRNSPISPEVGYVSSLDLGQILKVFATSHIRSSVRVVEGQAGSPLLNTRGEVVGMLVATDGTHSYALPTAAIRKIQPDLVKFNRPQYGFVGIGIRELTSDDKGNPLNEPKVVVEHLYPGTSAAQSGLQKGDELIEVNGAKVSQAADIMNATFYLRVSDKINVRVRNARGEEKDFTITIGPRPAAPAKPGAAPPSNAIPVSEKR